MANKTGTQIKTLAESYTEGDTILDANALIWLNEFLVSNLRDGAGIKDTNDYPNCVKYAKYDLPSNIVSNHKTEQFYASTMLDTEWYKDYYDYVMEDDQISFNDDGHFRLTYFVLPTELPALTANMTVNQVFDKACALWIAYRYLTNDDEDNAKNQSLGQLRLAEYNSEIRMAIENRMKMFKKRKRIRRGII